MSLFELAAKISLDTSEYDKGLDKASGKFNSFGDKVKGGLGTAAKIGAATVAAVGTATIGAGVAITKATGQVASYGDTIDKTSQKMGMSSTAYQEWDHILQHCGSSIEAMQPSMKTLSVQANKNAEEFQKLGISQEDVANMSKEELFAATISGLQKMEDGTQRTAIASKLLGRGATELGALLNMSSDETEQMRQRVHELGGVMSEDAVKASAQYQDSLQDLQTSMEGIKRNAVSEFLPGMTTVMDGLTAIFAGEEGGVGKVTEGVNNIIQKVGEVVPKFISIVGKVAQSVGSAILENLPTITTFLVNGAINVATALVENAPVILGAVTTILSSVWGAISSSAPRLLETVMQLLMQFTTYLAVNSGTIIESGMNLLNNLLQGIMDALPKLIAYMPILIGNLYTALANAFPKILEGGMMLLTTLLEGVLKAAPALIEAVPKITTQMLNAFLSVDWIGLGKKVITFIGNGVKLLITHLPQILLSIGNATYAIMTSIDWLGLGKTVIVTIGKGIAALVASIPKALQDIGKSGAKAFSDIDWGKVGKEIINGIKNGIVRFASNIANAAVNAARDAIEAVKDWLGIASPSKRAEKEIGKWMALGVGSGWEKYMPVDDMSDTMQDAFNEISAVPSIPDEEYIVTTDAEGGESRASQVFSPVINVYGSDGQSTKELAQEVMDIMAFEYQRRGSVFA